MNGPSATGNERGKRQSPLEVSKRERYEGAIAEVTAILASEGASLLDDIAVMATINAVLASRFDTFFWTGFYRVCGTRLIIGPYVGSVGCLEIEIGRGVCGTAAAQEKTVIVPDVTKFPGHIACDSRSRSEIVVPVFGRKGELIAVLDIDSETLDSFDEEDARGLEQICAIFATYS